MIKDSKKSKKENIWKASVVTLLPESFPGILNTSLTGKALRDNLWKLEIINLREYGEGRHRNVDDTPYGGGPGMVMRADILGKAIQKMINKTESAPLIYLSPRGKPFCQKKAQEFAKGPGVNLICGRFEGLDQRLIEHFNIEEVSIGDFILTGGEIAAQALIDATVRLIPSVIGNQKSIFEESFQNSLLEYSQYTKPSTWLGHDVPEVLLSGNHAKIKSWRIKQAERLTKEKRPDLWRTYCLENNKNPDED
tara:strand:- start:180 stop:932 length:753 start_codon:yes stop_codon:yes gene_type:complete